MKLDIIITVRGLGFSDCVVLFVLEVLAVLLSPYCVCAECLWSSVSLVLSVSGPQSGPQCLWSSVSLVLSVSGPQSGPQFGPQCLWSSVSLVLSLVLPVSGP